MVDPEGVLRPEAAAARPPPCATVRHAQSAAPRRPAASRGARLPRDPDRRDRRCSRLFVALPLLVERLPDAHQLATNMVILSLLAISFDLCWGFSGIMSFGQALFFGVAGYVVALVGNELGLQPALGVVPLGHAGRPAARRSCSAAFLLLGQAHADHHLRRARHAHRRPTPPSGWSPAGSMSAPATAFRSGQAAAASAPTSSSRARLLFPGADLPGRWSMPAPLPRALAVRPRARRHAPERGAARLLRLPVQVFKALVFSFAGMIAGPRRRALQLPPGLHRPRQHGPGPVDHGGASTACSAAPAR